MTIRPSSDACQSGETQPIHCSHSGSVAAIPYGYSLDPTFSPSRLSLLDRGFVYAIAHIRGGQELGRAWYEDGKLLKKKNTFTDFIDSAEFLIEAGYADPARLYGMGGSAGGLLIGAVMKATRGQADAKTVRELILQKLS